MRLNDLRSLPFPSNRVRFAQDCIFCAQLLCANEWGLCSPCQQELQRPTRCCSLCMIPLEIASGEEPHMPLICGQCLQQPPVFDQLTISAIYKPPFSHLITRYKYSAAFYCGRLLAKLMADAIIDSRSAQLPDCMLPVPLHWSRQFTRGFNQSTLLARQIRARLHKHYHLQRHMLPVSKQLLRRRAHTTSQITQGVHGRLTNVRGAFELRQGAQIPRSVAIVDDVLTTGATVNEIAHLLKQAGVERVEVWAAARTP